MDQKWSPEALERAFLKKFSFLKSSKAEILISLHPSDSSSKKPFRNRVKEIHVH